MTSLGQISTTNAEEFMSTLNDEAFIHSVSIRIPDNSHCQGFEDNDSIL